MEFQALSWEAEDIEGEDGILQYHTKTFGKTADGKSVYGKISYNPRFYVEITKGMKAQRVIDAIRQRTCCGACIERKFECNGCKGKSSTCYGCKQRSWEGRKTCCHNLKSAKIIESKKFFGFTNGESFKFIKLVFKNKQSFTRMMYTLKKPFKVDNKDSMYNVFEANFDPMLRMCHLRDTPPAGWFNVTDYELCDSSMKESYCDIEFTVAHTGIHPSTNQRIAPLVQASFDIETYSPDGSFPDPEHPECYVIQIGTTLQRFGDKEPYKRHIVSLKGCTAIDGVEIESFENERDVLNAWARMIQDENVDILIGYNIWKFDLSYMFKRAKITDAGAFMNVGRLKDKDCQLTERQFSSSAYGDNDYEMVSTPGIFQIDLLVIMQREHKLTSYSLNTVAEHFLGEKKVDLPVKEMFKKWTQTDDDRRDIAVYCIQDTALPLRIINKLAILPNMIEMAKATWVPVNFLIERGQGIKVFSQILYNTLKNDMVVVTINRDADKKQEEYEGATVLGAKKGAYMEVPITGLDFASLYPTIMMAHNLCHSTYVMSPEYDNIEGVEYFEYESHRFAQTIPGVLPTMLSDLAKNRKQAKKDMAHAKSNGDDFMYQVYNGKQLAFKVSMNSIYGFCGATIGALPCKQVAASTTGIGRNMIEKTKNMVEEWYPGSDVVYGDSVLPYTPVIVRRQSTGEVFVKTIEDLSKEWCAYPGFLKEGEGKQRSEVIDMDAWTHNGWMPIKRVVRHKCKKKIYRVVTHTGVVDVTEDHSLLSLDVELLKPADVVVGQRLLHSFPVLDTNVLDVSAEKLFLLGMFVGDGSCGTYESATGRKNFWAINNQDLDLLATCKVHLEREYPNYTFRIIDTMNSSGFYELAPKGKLESFVKEWRELCYDGKAKKVPQCAMGSRSFFDGLFRGRNNLNTIGTDSQITAQWYYIFLTSLGYNVSINTRADKSTHFRLTFLFKKFHKPADTIKKIHILHDEWSDFVYDLETEAGTFQAGVGQMIVKNTDSVMVKFNVDGKTGQDAIDASFTLGEEAASRISATFKKPIELEFEKVYFPYLLFSKKRYAGLMYTKPDKPDYIDAKGIHLVRRDNCQMVRDTSKKVLDIIMYDRDIDKAIAVVKDVSRRLMAGTIDVMDLVVSKSLKRITYEWFIKKNNKFVLDEDGKMIKLEAPELITAYKMLSQPHLTVAKKRETREIGTGPKSGDRVPYVFIDTGNPKDKQYVKAEDPIYARDNKLELDSKYYLEHALLSPVQSIFELFLDDPKSELFGEFIPQKKPRAKKKVIIDI